MSNHKLRLKCQLLDTVSTRFSLTVSTGDLQLNQYTGILPGSKTIKYLSISSSHYVTFA